MSMTKSRARADTEKWRAAHKAEEPLRQARRRYEETYTVILEIRRQMEALNGTGYVPHVVWLGRKHFERFLWEMKAVTRGSFVPTEFDGIPVRRQACPGVNVMPRLSDRWERIVAEDEARRSRGCTMNDGVHGHGA